MIDIASVVLQNLTDSEEVQGRCSETCPTISHELYLPISIKAEVLSDVEEEEDPLAITFSGIKAEPEVSCGSVSVLAGFHKYSYPSFYKHSIYDLLLQ
jgi:hypothetical protein